MTTYLFISELENKFSSKLSNLFIDGTNLYAAQYELFGPKKYLDFSKFIRKVEKKIEVKFDKIYFYASYSPKPKKQAIENQSIILSSDR